MSSTSHFFYPDRCPHNIPANLDRLLLTAAPIIQGHPAFMHIQA